VERAKIRLPATRRPLALPLLLAPRLVPLPLLLLLPWAVVLGLLWSSSG
jgi:hypothetical protein